VEVEYIRGGREEERRDEGGDRNAAPTLQKKSGPVRKR